MSKIQINPSVLGNLICKKEEHQNKPIEFICKFPDCEERLNCLHCLLNEHSGHFTSMQLFKNFFQKLDEKKPVKENFLTNLIGVNENEKNPETSIKTFESQIQKEKETFFTELSNTFKEFDSSINKLIEKIPEANKTSLEMFGKKINELKNSKFESEDVECKTKKITTKSDLDEYLNNKFGKKKEKINQPDSTLRLILELKTLQISSIRMNDSIVESLRSTWKTFSAGFGLINEENLNYFAFLRMKGYVPSSDKDIKNLKVVKTVNTSHKKSIYRIVFLENEQKFATASDDSSIILWNSSSGAVIHTFMGHTDRIWTLIKLGEIRLASGSSDHKIKIWNTQALTLEKTLSWHTAFVCALLELPGNLLLSGSHDKCLKVWDYLTGKQIRSFKGENQGKIMKIIWLNLDQVCVGSDSNINVYDFNQGKIEYTMTSHTALVRDLLLMDDLETLFSTSDDHKIKMWNLISRECLRTFSGHTHSANLVLLFNMSTVVTASDDSAIKFWNINNGTLVHTLTGHSSWVIYITILKDGTLVSVGADKIVRFWG